ncbi:arginase [Longimicrobium sp.]|uniref:arginase n=1 Tax=Longimicrobium sp. TaxID=2029185 RepID=UPI003B3B49C9
MVHVDLIGVPLDFGAGRRGVDMGPSAIRYADLQLALEGLGLPVSDLGNIPVPVRESCPPGDSTLKYLEPIVEVQARLADRVAASVEQGHFPLVLGGDHSLSAGSVMGALRHRRLGLIWLDAHGDFNTDQTSLSGNIHGMPLAALCGRGAEPLVTLAGREALGPKLQPRNVAVVGVRDLDVEERTLMRAAGVNVWSMEAIDRVGIREVMRQAIEAASQGTEGIWLSLDLDVLDPTFAPGVGTPVMGGLNYREAHLAVELVAETGRLRGMDLVEVNPIMDRENATGKLAVQLAASALGKRIWDAP